MGLADEQLAETRIRISSGAAPETEIAQPRAELERRRGDLLASREASSRAENALKLLILDDDDDLWLDRLVPAEDAAAEATPGDVASALERALASRPELEAARPSSRAAAPRPPSADDAVKPRLDAVLSYDRFGLAGERNPAGGDGPRAARRVPPGSKVGGAGRGRRSARATSTTPGSASCSGSRSATAAPGPPRPRPPRSSARPRPSSARARKVIRAEVLDAAAALETTGGRIEAARAAREAAEVQLAAERERYAVGLSTNFLVLTRQNDLARARLDEISALTDHRIARTGMARATGSLLDERGIRIDTPTGVDATK